MSPTSLAMRVGDQSRLTVAGVTAQGTTVNTMGPISWTTSNSAVVTINGNGNVRAGGVGSATVTATVRGLSVSAGVVVAPR
jgi:uncharacterized protein YjdB